MVDRLIELFILPGLSSIAGNACQNVPSVFQEQPCLSNMHIKYKHVGLFAKMSMVKLLSLAAGVFGKIRAKIKAQLFQ